MTHTPATHEAVQALAIPTIRNLLHQRRNAERHSKAFLLSRLNCDLRRAIRAALLLGVTPEEMHERLGKAYDSIRGAVIIEARAVALIEAHVLDFDRETLSKLGEVL